MFHNFLALLVNRQYYETVNSIGGLIQRMEEKKAKSEKLSRVYFLGNKKIKNQRYIKGKR